MTWNAYPPVADWMDLDERRFHHFLMDRVRAGVFADAFPLMVMHNVPHYVLATMWPERWAEYRRAPQPVAFAIAEEGWRGRVKNVTSSIVPDGPGYRLEFAKNYVVESEVVVVFARMEKGFGLAAIRRGSGETWQERTEPHVKFVSSAGDVITHYRVSGSIRVNAADVHHVSGSVYSQAGRTIPVREISSAAVLFTAVAQSQGIALPPELSGAASDIIEGRAGGLVDKALAGKASQLFEQCFRLISESGGSLDPFWGKLREYAMTAAK